MKIQLLLLLLWYLEYKNDKRLIALEEARKAYESDERVNKLMMEYEVQQKAMQNEVAKSDRDMQMIEAIQRRTDELYTLISEHPVFAELNRTQSEVNELMNAVNQTIMTQITGEEPSGCTHNCSTCGGCH